MKTRRLISTMHDAVRHASLFSTHYSAASVDSRKKLPYFDNTSSFLIVSGDFERSGRAINGEDLSIAASNEAIL